MRPRQVSDEDILDTARRMFLEHGPSVSTTVIAQEVGLSQAALFKRFHTKHDLLLRALSPIDAPGWILLVEKGVDDRPILDQLRHIAREMTVFFDQLIPCLAMLRAAVDPREIMARHPNPPPVRGRRALAAWFAEAADRGLVRSVEPGSAAQALIGAMHGRAFMKHVTADIQPSPYQDDELDPYVEHLLDVLWRGLAPADPEPTP
jgi:AcrR family transcriptional regulator